MTENIIIHRAPNKDLFTLEKEENPYIVETAGFIPLEVKFKRFEQAGIRAQFSTSEFTSHDYRDMYLGPDTEIHQYDDMETVIEKLQLQEQLRNEILTRNSKLSNLAEEKRSDDEVSSKVLEGSSEENVLDKELPSDKI